MAREHRALTARGSAPSPVAPAWASRAPQPCSRGFASLSSRSFDFWARGHFNTRISILKHQSFTEHPEQPEGYNPPSPLFHHPLKETAAFRGWKFSLFKCLLFPIHTYAISNWQFGVEMIVTGIQLIHWWGSRSQTCSWRLPIPQEIVNTPQLLQHSECTETPQPNSPSLKALFWLLGHFGMSTAQLLLWQEHLNRDRFYKQKNATILRSNQAPINLAISISCGTSHWIWTTLLFCHHSPVHSEPEHLELQQLFFFLSFFNFIKKL